MKLQYNGVNNKYLIFFSLFVLLASGISAYAVFDNVYAEQQTQYSNQECIFTSYIEKSWVMFGDRPFITGFVINCDDSIHYSEKDFVH